MIHTPAYQYAISDIVMWYDCFFCCFIDILKLEINTSTIYIYIYILLLTTFIHSKLSRPVYSSTEISQARSDGVNVRLEEEVLW